MRISDWSSDVCSSDLALVEQALDAVDLLLAGRDLLGRGAVGQGDQDVGQVVLLAGLRGQGGVHFGFADADPGLREPLPQPLGQQFVAQRARSEEHTSELQSLMRNSYAVFCLKKKNNNN